MRLYLVSIRNIGLSSLSKESIWQNKIRRFQVHLASGSFVTPIQLGGALVIAEIQRKHQIVMILCHQEEIIFYIQNKQTNAPKYASILIRGFLLLKPE